MPDYKNIVNFNTHANKKNFMDYKQTGGGAPPPSLYQEWAGYADSPETLGDYPYQCIGKYSTQSVYLYLSTTKFYTSYDAGSYGRIWSDGTIYRYTWSGSAWTGKALQTFDGMYVTWSTFYERNYDVYTDATLTTVAYAKTTP